MPDRRTKWSGEELHAMGKRAAARWGSGACRTLTDAVIAVVKEASGLNAQQVQRVVEFTNTEAHNAEFRKQGSPDKIVDFDGGPARAPDVLRALNDGSSRGSYVAGSGDYDRPPPGTKQSEDEEARMLAALFPHSGKEEGDPLAEARALRHKIAAEYARARGTVGDLSWMEQELLTRIADRTKTALLEGASLADVALAWRSVSDDASVKVAFEWVLPGLLGSVFEGPEQAVASLKKHASASRVNPNHPLVLDFRDYHEVATKLSEEREREVDARGALDWFDAFEKDASKEGIIPAAMRHLGNASQLTEGAGRALGGALGGETGARVLGFAGKAAPYAATGLAANEAYRQTVKYNPVAQAALGAVRSAIPGTQEYNQREYELAMGGGGMF